jgi:hypothetical protein
VSIVILQNTSYIIASYYKWVRDLSLESNNTNNKAKRRQEKIKWLMSTITR